MATEKNKALVRRDLEAWNRENLTELLASIEGVYACDFVYHAPNLPPVRSREEWKHFSSAFQAALPGQITVEDLIAEEDKVVVRYTYRCTHQGPWRGLPATGKAVTFTGTLTYRIVDGKVGEAWENPDQLSVLRQLGILPPGMEGEDPALHSGADHLQGGWQRKWPSRSRSCTPPRGRTIASPSRKNKQRSFRP